jgi:hypothetical protein
MLNLRTACGRDGSLELIFEFRDLKLGNEFARCDAVSDVDANRVHVARHLCVNHHILEGIEFPLERH